MTVNELMTACNFEAVCLPDADREVSGAYVGDLLSWVMGRAQADNAWITIMSNVNVIAVASLSDVACVCSLSHGQPPGERSTVIILTKSSKLYLSLISKSADITVLAFRRIRKCSSQLL